MTLRQLKQVRKFLTESRWTKNSYCKGENYEEISIQQATDNSYFCISGAVGYLSNKNILKGSVTPLIRLLEAAVRTKRCKTVMEFNDRRETRYEDVVEIFNIVEDFCRDDSRTQRLSG